MKRYLKLRWKETMIACIFFALNVFSVTASSFMFMKTIDAVTGGDRAMIWRFLLYQVLLWAAAALTYYVAWIWKGKTDKGIANDMRRDISALLMKKSYQQFEEKEIGEYLSWYSNDVAQLNMWAVSPFFSLVTCILQIVMSAAALCMVHWALSAAALSGSVLLLGVSAAWKKSIRKKADATSEVSERFYSGMKNILSGFTIMKNFHIMNQFKQQTHVCSEDKEEVNYQYTKVQVASNACLTLCDGVFRVTVIGICAFLIFRGKLQVSAIIGVSSFMPSIFDGLMQAVAYKNSLVASKVYFEKYDKEWQKIRQNASEGKPLQDISQGICIRELGYHYGEKAVFEKLNFQIRAGKKYALVGSSGSGKTTLMKLLLGQLSGYEGELLYDEVNAKEYDPESITDKIAYIEQNVYLFDTTIRNNITLWGDFTEQEIENALRESALFDDMKLFPQGLETPVGENGKNLSGGQRQRIAVARALIHEKKILFVDEGTSALDRKNAEIIETKLLKNPELTLLLISHHLEEERREQFDGILELQATS